MTDQTEKMFYISDDESSCELSYYNDSESSSQWSTPDDLDKDPTYNIAQDRVFYSDDD